ncbi:DUF1330 domain-containing protein [Gilvibacter sp.]|uniref:DUF1330 domain-containing protein n=1 Tax=Gilvibacter sp. TaxID=2729997 RepID=UPI003F49E8E6
MDPNYVHAVGEIVARHGGKYLVRTTNYQRLEGEGENPAAFIIIEWPTKKLARLS